MNKTTALGEVLTSVQFLTAGGRRLAVRKRPPYDYGDLAGLLAEAMG